MRGIDVSRHVRNALGRCMDAPPSLVLHPRFLKPATFPGFPLYLRRDDSYTLFRTRDDAVYLNTWNKLLLAGADTVYVRGRDAGACLDYVEEHLDWVLQEGEVPAMHLAGWMYRLACRAMQHLLENPDDTAGLQRVKKLLNPLLESICHHRECEWLMLDHAPQHYHTWSHSVNVCLLLVSFAKRVMGVIDRKLLMEVALGGILHDVGKARIPEAILEKPTELTAEEFARIKAHPDEGLRLARPHLKPGSVARRIIGQHHEHADGKGYPNGRHGDAIDIFARAAHIADAFDALTTRRPYGPALTDYQAINTMITGMSGQFDLKLLRRFIRMFSGEHQPPRHVTQPELLVGPPIEGTVPEEPKLPPRPDSTPRPALDFLPALRNGLHQARRAGARRRELRPFERILRQLEGPLAADLGECLRVLERDGIVTEDGGEAGEQAPSAAQTHGATRPLMSVIWRLDEWLRRLEDLACEPESALGALRTGTIDCLQGLRREALTVLDRCGVYILDSATRFDPITQRPVGRGVLEPGTPVRVERAGFMFAGPHADVYLELPHVVPTPRKQATGAAGRNVQ